jgi:hypothetical protein
MAATENDVDPITRTGAGVINQQQLALVHHARNETKRNHCADDSIRARARTSKISTLRYGQERAGTLNRPVAAKAELPQ